ncbi:MAG: MGMT family protein [Cytophagales bacterium]|nr:MAG: MGMT family protein [Cytophagales bacterium]TAF59443.1 MAG: MGMT family protein [Cytophagales bacterium]
MTDSKKAHQLKKNKFNEVFDLVRLIPYGRVCTYGHIANYLGVAYSARTVGWAMRQSPPDVPAHRVVNRLGELTGRLFFATPTLMEELLISEGVCVEDSQIKNFESYLWLPEKELY